jgi:hypothetical protein
MNMRIVLLALMASAIFSWQAHAESGPAKERIAEQWVGSWATAPQPALPGKADAMRNQTARLIVRSSIGGSKIRIRISNTYGSEPLLIGGAHIARTVKDTSSIDPATDRVLLFQGQGRVSIAAGTTVVSDAVALNVSALADLTISLFFRRDGARRSHSKHGVSRRRLAELLALPHWRRCDGGKWCSGHRPVR